MLSTTAVLLTIAASALVARAYVKCRIAARTRESLRQHAERLIIEKRWIERAARSRQEYETRWHFEMRELHRTHVPRLARLLFDFTAFTWALDAEFACLTNQEIASWTFIDRMSETRAGFERLVARCLERDGWQVAALQGADRVDLHLIASHGSRRVGIHCHHGAFSPECLAVHDAAIGRNRQRCDAVCIVSNGRFSGAVSVFAKTQDVALLHCSQLDQIAGLVRRPKPREDFVATVERMAA